MADNVTSNPGTGGYVFATDFNIPKAEHWPLMKVTWGTRDSAYNIVDQLNALPVQDAVGQDMLPAILLELRTISQLLALGFNIRDNLDTIRYDPTGDF